MSSKAWNLKRLMCLAKIKAMVAAVVVVVQLAAARVKAVVVQVAVMVLKLAARVKVVDAAIAAQVLVNAQAMTAVMLASHVTHQVSQMSVLVASRIKANVRVLAAAKALASHVVSVLQPVAVVQVAAKVVLLAVQVQVARAKVVLPVAIVTKTHNKPSVAARIILTAPIAY